jgi:hypothetical protein
MLLNMDDMISNWVSIDSVGVQFGFCLRLGSHLLVRVDYVRRTSGREDQT